MYSIRFSLFIFLSILFVGLQSCSEDDLGSNVDLLAAENFNQDRRAGPNGGGGDRPRGNDPRPDNTDDRQAQEVITAWLDLYLEMDRYATGMRPTSTARALAYIHLAGFESMVPSMDTYISNAGKLVGLDIDNHENIQIDYHLALNACYADVYEHFMLNIPDEFYNEIDDLESNLDRNLRRNLSKGVVENSRNWGASVASQVIAYSQTDGAAEEQIYDPQPLSYEPPVGDGYWTYSAEPERALFPYWGSVRTFIISSDQTSTIAPMQYSSDPQSTYYQQMLEVQQANNQARAEDGEDLWIAEFWSDDVEGLMFSPPARQISIAKQLIDRRDLSVERSLHLLLKIGFTLNDAAVSAWQDKYEYMVMRPSVYIQNYLDPNYQTNLYRLIPWPNPTFPSYPSGHSAFAGAAAGVFIDFFGNEINFTDRSHAGRTEFRGDPRSYDSFTEMAAENGYSRLPLGVNMEIDCTEGLRLGYEVADAVNAYNLRRART